MCVKTDSSEENLWVCADVSLSHGVHYFSVKCEAKGTRRRYVGVGVGKANCRFPNGAARLLSDGNLKSGLLTQKADLGFVVGDVVGVLVDVDQGIVSFDVNGDIRGKIAIPDLAPGEVVQPLVYVCMLFTPDD